MNKVPFTGFDVFFLALERQYKKQGHVGNVCRYVIDIEGTLDIKTLESHINQNPIVKQLKKLRYKKPHFAYTPYWYESPQQQNIYINTLTSSELLPESISNKNLSKDELFCFHLIQREGQTQTLVFSWNHLLMDGYGVSLFIQQLFAELQNPVFVDPKEIRPKLNLPTLWEATKAKFFIDRTSKSPVSCLSFNEIQNTYQSQAEVITFTEEETSKIDQSAMKSGARFGRSSYYLACTSFAVKGLLEKKQKQVSNFWVPVPRDNRKKGALGPIIGNRLSFLFYRLSKNHLESIPTCVKAINQQMMQQIKERRPLEYNSLMEYMKWIPLNLYYYWVKRKNSNPISSFLFTVAPDHPKELQNILNQKITRTINLPANPHPPGLTFAFMHHKGALQLIVSYYRDILTFEDFSHLKSQMKYELVNGEKWDGIHSS